MYKFKSYKQYPLVLKLLDLNNKTFIRSIKL